MATIKRPIITLNNLVEVNDLVTETIVCPAFLKMKSIQLKISMKQMKLTEVKWLKKIVVVN